MIARTARLLDAAAAADRAVATPIWPRDRACPPAPAMPPLAEPVIVLSDPDLALTRDPTGAPSVIAIGTGIHLDWAPAAPLSDGVVLVQFVGIPPIAGHAAIVSRPGLRNLIADLQAIDAQLEDRR